MHSQQVQIGCIQESQTRQQEATNKLEHGTFFGLCAPDTTDPSQQQHGLGFYVANQWTTAVTQIHRPHNRICYIQIDMNDSANNAQRRPKYLIVINAYAPHSGRDATERREFYTQLQTEYQNLLRTAALIFIGGDFNAKIGLRSSPDETFLGKHGKGTRNASGHMMVDFLQENQLYATNTTFRNRMTNRSTFAGYFSQPLDPLLPLEQRQIKWYFNTIDYVLFHGRTFSDIQASFNARDHMQAIPSWAQTINL